MTEFSDLKILPKIIRIEMTVKKPSAEEVETLTKATFDKEKLFADKKRLAKEKFKYLGWASVLALVFLFAGGFFYLILLAFEDAPGAFRGLLWLVVLATPFIAVGCIIMGIVNLFKSDKMETAEKVNEAWLSAIFGTQPFRKVKTTSKNRIDVLDCLTTEKVDRNKVKQYIDNTRKTLADTMDEITLGLIETHGLTPVYTDMKKETVEVTKLYPSLKEVKSIITFTDINRYGGFDKTFESVIVKLHITQYFINAGDSWYPYELMPELEIIPSKYDETGEFHDGLAKVRLNDKWGYADKTDQEVIPCKYDAVSVKFSDGLAKVELNFMRGFIDKTGQEVIPLIYDNACDFSEGLAVVKLNGKWGYIDKTGQEVTPCKYDYVKSFSESLAAVKLKGKWGYIDKTGQEVIPRKYNYAWNFSDGLAYVELKRKMFKIDKTGNRVE
jgi:hypothetical protein